MYIYISYLLRIVCIIVIFAVVLRNNCTTESLIKAFLYSVPFEISLSLVSSFSLEISDLILVILIIRLATDNLTLRIRVSMRITILIVIIVTSLIISLLFVTLTKNYTRYFVQSAKIVVHISAAILIVKALIRTKNNVIPFILTNLKNGILINSFIGLIVFSLSVLLRSDVLPTARNFSILGPSGYYQSMPLIGTPLFRAHSFGEPKSLAAWTTLGIIICMTQLLSENSRLNRSILFWQSIILIITTMLTFSRGGLIIVSLVVVWYLITIVFFRPTGRHDVILLIVIFCIVTSTVLLTSTLETGILKTFEAKEDQSLLEEYDSAILNYYKSNPAMILLPVGVAYAEEKSRPYLPLYAHWSFGSDFTIRRGLILFIVQYGVILGIPLLLFFIKEFSTIILVRDTSSIFFLGSWFIYYTLEVSHSTISVHRIILVCILYSVFSSQLFMRIFNSKYNLVSGKVGVRKIE